MAVSYPHDGMRANSNARLSPASVVAAAGARDPGASRSPTRALAGAAGATVTPSLISRAAAAAVAAEAACRASRQWTPSGSRAAGGHTPERQLEARGASGLGVQGGSNASAQAPAEPPTSAAVGRQARAPSNNRGGAAPPAGASPFASIATRGVVIAAVSTDAAQGGTTPQGATVHDSAPGTAPAAEASTRASSGDGSDVAAALMELAGPDSLAGPGSTRRTTERHAPAQRQRERRSRRSRAEFESGGSEAGDGASTLPAGQGGAATGASTQQATAPPKPKRRRVSRSEREAALRRVFWGRASVDQVAAELGVSQRAVYRWIRTARLTGSTARATMLDHKRKARECKVLREIDGDADGREDGGSGADSDTQTRAASAGAAADTVRGTRMSPEVKAALIKLITSFNGGGPQRRELTTAALVAYLREQTGEVVPEQAVKTWLERIAGAMGVPSFVAPASAPRPAPVHGSNASGSAAGCSAAADRRVQAVRGQQAAYVQPAAQPTHPARAVSAVAGSASLGPPSYA